MTRFASQTLAALAAVTIALTSLSAVTSVPAQPQFVAVAAPVLA